MEYTGKINPERRIEGRKYRNVDRIACCWVLDIVDIKSPTEILVRIKTRDDSMRNMKLPLNGTLNQKIVSNVIRTISTKLTTV